MSDNILTVEEIIDIVDAIENDMVEQTGLENSLVFSTNGKFDTIVFLGSQIWNSDEDDERPVLSEVDGFITVESLDSYLRRLINNKLFKLCQAKL